MNKNKNIIIDFLNEYYIINKNITLKDIHYNLDTKKFNIILLFKLERNLITNNTKIIYLNDFKESDFKKNDFNEKDYLYKYYDNSIEKVSEYIYYIKNYLNSTVQNILFNDFKYNKITENIIIGAGLYLIHSNYYKVWNKKNNEIEESYYFYFLDKD